MPVRYIRVNPVADLFAPAVRAYGNIAVVGTVTPPAQNPPADLLAVGAPVVFTDPSEARRRAPGALAAAISLCFTQAPGPTLVYGVRVDSTTLDWAAGLAALEAIDVQIVCLANTPLTATTGAANGAIRALVD